MITAHRPWIDKNTSLLHHQTCSKFRIVPRKYNHQTLDVIVQSLVSLPAFHQCLFQRAPGFVPEIPTRFPFPGLRHRLSFSRAICIATPKRWCASKSEQLCVTLSLSVLCRTRKLSMWIVEDLPMCTSDTYNAQVSALGITACQSNVASKMSCHTSQTKAALLHLGLIWTAQIP